MPRFPVLLGDLSYPLALAEGWSSPSLMPQLALTTDHMKLRPSWATLSPKKKVRENTKFKHFRKKNLCLSKQKTLSLSFPFTTQLSKHLNPLNRTIHA